VSRPLTGNALGKNQPIPQLAALFCKGLRGSAFANIARTGPCQASHQPAKSPSSSGSGPGQGACRKMVQEDGATKMGPYLNVYI